MFRIHTSIHVTITTTIAIMITITITITITIIREGNPQNENVVEKLISICIYLFVLHFYGVGSDTPICALLARFVPRSPRWAPYTYINTYVCTSIYLSIHLSLSIYR